jgi:hypothetical protein
MKIFAALIILLAVSDFALAAPKKKKANLPPPPRPDVVVTVPSSEIEIPAVPEEVSPPATMEIGSSTYVPKNFVRPTYSSGSAKFERGPLPFFTLNRMGEISQLAEWNLLWKAGVFGNSLERTVAIPTTTGSRQATQKLTFLGLRLGTEIQTPKVKRLRAFAGISALPLFALSPASSVEGSVSKLAVAGELVGGILFQPKFLEEFWGFRRGGIAVSAHHLEGKVENSELKSTGVLGSFRVDL